jgi:hypothetical protein
MTNYKLISIDAINELIHFKFTYEIAKDYPPMRYKEITRKSRVLTKDILAMFDNAPSVECEPIGWTTKVQLSFLDNGEVMLVYPADTCEAEIPIYTTPQDQSAKIAELEAKLKVAEGALEAIAMTDKPSPYSFGFINQQTQARNALNKIRGE